MPFLDFDLLLRDQRMLTVLQDLPRKARVVLRNTLTKRYPAVPIPNEVVLDEKLEWHELQKVPVVDETTMELTYVGKQNSVEMSKQMQQWQQDLDDRLKGKKLPPKYWEFPELEKGNIHKHCSKCFDANCKRTLQIAEPEDTSCSVLACRWECGAVYHACKASEHLIVCPLYVEPDEFDWMYKGMASRANRKHLDKSSKKDNITKAAAPSVGDIFVGPGEPAVKSNKRIPDAPPLPAKLASTHLNLRIDTIRKQHSKPKTMYTFVCGQFFRRDEYSWHCKNVHDDVIGGMDDWIEHRCPLAFYGCGFSARKMFPGSKRSCLIFSPAVESFGLKPLKQPVKQSSKQSQRSLLDLPFEIIFEIVNRLDSFR